MAQKQNPKKALLCTYKTCKNLQDENGEFCPNHYPNGKLKMHKTICPKCKKLIHHTYPDVLYCKKCNNIYKIEHRKGYYKAFTIKQI